MSRETYFNQQLKLHMTSLTIIKNKNMVVVFHFIHKQQRFIRSGKIINKQCAASVNITSGLPLFRFKKKLSLVTFKQGYQVFPGFLSLFQILKENFYFFVY